nr:O-antigen ligase family protein [Curtobacterium pusillum]
MLQLVSSVAIAMVAARRPVWGVSAVLVAAAVLPFDVVRTSFGTSWHPATTVALALMVVESVRNPSGVGRAVGRHLVVVAMLATFFVIALATSWFTGRAGDIGTLVLQLLAPALLLLYIRTRAEDTPGLPAVLARLFVVVAAAEALVVLGVWSGVVPQPWLSTLEGLRWWGTDSDRMSGTFDHPLVAALWMSAAVPLCASLRIPWWRITVPVLLVVGVALTGSRFALLAAVVSVAALILRARTSSIAKAGAVVLAVVGMAAFLTSAVASTVTDRLEDDGGSSSARLKSFGLAVEQWGDTLIIGRGFGASEQVTRNALIGTTFENPFLMFSVDFGLVATVLFFGALITLLLAGRTGRPGRVRGSRTAAFLVLVSIFGFNSLSTNAPIGVLLFVLLALVPPAVGRRPLADGVSPDGIQLGPPALVVGR